MEIILSNVFCLKGDTVTYVPADAYKPQSWKKPRTTISSKLKMFISELPFADKNLSLILLFPAKKFPKWKIGGTILELVERLTAREGIDELRRVLLDNQESSTKILREEMLLYPDFFRLENELDINDLLNELGIKSFLEPDKSTLSKFTDENLHLGGAKHRAYIKVTQKTVTAGAVNIFFTKEEGSFKPTAGINDFIYRGKKFLWLLYCRESHTILFIGSVNEEVPLSSPTGCFERIRRMFR
ncbi:serine protease inhibitor 88Ea-like [Nylanderia fulva]|uniref:serine protease inhibitor 88Ea-like n=1 Tax=Nylanderia fulva TaxID=613905 RepID=UPI0010FB3C63|nr:serine protease inhibitor 88Ea-like [Nylanderia fulva]